VNGTDLILHIIRWFHNFRFGGPTSWMALALICCVSLLPLALIAKGLVNIEWGTAFKKKANLRCPECGQPMYRGIVAFNEQGYVCSNADCNVKGVFRKGWYTAYRDGSFKYGQVGWE
jgi:hypothetical protein